MFDLEAQIKRWREELVRSGIRDQEVVDELEAHLREKISRLPHSETIDAEKFRMAVALMGDAKILKKEFEKTRRLRFLGCRNNPTGLNILAFWLILIGLTSLPAILHVWSDLPKLIHVAFQPGPLQVVPIISSLSVMGLCLCFALPIPIGIGLLHQINACRTMAMGFTAFLLVLAGLNWISLGVIHVFALVNLAMLIWGLYLLRTPQVKNLFRRAAVE